jgi:DNA-binding transcriptional LysR family regulator
MAAAGRRLAQAMTAAMETIQLGLDEIEQRPVDHKELRILVPATLSMHRLVPRLPRIEQADPGFRLRVHTTHMLQDPDTLEGSRGADARVGFTTSNRRDGGYWACC